MTISKIKSCVYRLLRRSERYTGTDMVYLAKGSFWLSLGNVIIIIGSLATAVAFANLIPKEVYGQYRYAISIFAILKLFTLGGMGTAVSRAVAMGYEGSVIQAIYKKIKWGTIGALSGLAISLYFYFNGNIALAITFLIVGLFVPFFETFNIYSSYFNGKKLFSNFAKYNAILEITTSIILVIVLFLTDNLYIILLSYFLSYTILRLLLLAITLNKYRLNNKVDPRTMSYGKHLSAMNILTSIANNIDKIILWHFLGAVMVALYSFALAIPNQIKVATNELKTLALPKFSAADPAIIKKTLAKKVFKACLFLAPIVFIYIIAAPFIFKIFFPKYTEAVLYSQIFSISILFTPQALFLTYLESQMKKKQLYFTSFFSPSLRILLFLILIPPFGIMGAIISFMAARAINFASLYYLFKKS